MLVLKLQRRGKKHQPFYRLVVSERRSKVTGQEVENLGWYDPKSKERKFNKERILHWLQNGAQKTDSVHNLLIKDGIIEGSKIAVHNKPKASKEEVEGSKVEKENQSEKTMELKMQLEENTPESPMEEAPAEAPAEETPAEAPMESPMEEAPAEAPAEEAPMESPMEEAPAEAPAEEAPMEAPAEAPAEEETPSM